MVETEGDTMAGRSAAPSAMCSSRKAVTELSTASVYRGQRLALQKNARPHVVRNDAELDSIALVPLGPCGSGKVDSEVYSMATRHDAGAPREKLSP